MENLCFLFFLISIGLVLFLAYKAFVFKRPFEEIIEELEYKEDATEEERDMLFKYIYCVGELKNPYIPLMMNFVMWAIAAYKFPENLESAFEVLLLEFLLVFPISFIVTIHYCHKNIETRHKYDIYDAVLDATDMGTIASCVHGLYSVGKKAAGSSKRQLDYFKHHHI